MSNFYSHVRKHDSLIFHDETCSNLVVVPFKATIFDAWGRVFWCGGLRSFTRGVSKDWKLRDKLRSSLSIQGVGFPKIDTPPLPPLTHLHSFHTADSPLAIIYPFVYLFPSAKITNFLGLLLTSFVSSKTPYLFCLSPTLFGILSSVYNVTSKA